MPQGESETHVIARTCVLRSLARRRGNEGRLRPRTSNRLHVMDSKAPKPTPPFVWPLPAEGTGPEPDELLVPFEDALADAKSIAGIVSGIDSSGVGWIEELLREPERKALLILAVYAGCPTRKDDLLRLLALQRRRTAKTEFRVLPMTGGSGAPGNCLATIPADGASPVFFFGTTPNFGIARFDTTQINMAFQADPLLTNKWSSWLDSSWAEATALTESTARIPSLVPARGSADAAAQWREYCDLLAHEPEQPKQEETPSPDDDNSESPAEESAQSESEDQAPSESIGIRKLDELAERVTRLFQNGKQVVIDHESIVKPLKVSVTPELFGQSREYWEGPVGQFQSFQISTFSKDELSVIEKYRTCSQTLLEKLGLPLGSGMRWMPARMISIYEREITSKGEEAKNALIRLIGKHSRTYVDGKKEEIEQYIKRTHQRLGGDGYPPPEILDKVLNRLLIRIDNALKSSLLAQPTYSEYRPVLYGQGSIEAHWAQVQRLVLALTRFPRKVLHRRDILAGMATSQSEIMQAMNIADDAILKIDQYEEYQVRRESVRDLGLLNWIAKSNIKARDRCKACLMMIDGVSHGLVHEFVLRSESQK